MIETPPAKMLSESRAAAKNGGGMPYSSEDPTRRRNLLIGGIGCAGLVVAMALLFIFRPWQHAAPKLGGEPSKLGQYVGTEDFHQMSFAKREVYMKMMNAKKEQVVKSYAAGQLSLEDYQKSMLAAHLGKQLDDMRKYFAKPLGAERVKFLDKLLVKKDAKEELVKGNPVTKEEKKEQDLLKDDAAEKAEVATWPEDVQNRYQQYRTALADRKKAHKAVKDAKATAGGTGTAGLTTRPGE